MEHTYEFWQRAQAGEKVGGPTLPLHDGVAHPGFYRTHAKPPKGQKYRDQPWLPVAIFVHDGELIATVGEDQADPARIWNFCCEHHVSEAAYRKAVETGRWDDVDPNVQPKAHEEIQTTIAPPPMGDNVPADESVTLKDQIETAKAGLKAYAKIGDDETAKKAQSLRSRLLELAREAFNKHKDEKEPHLRAGQAVDRKWNPLRQDAQAAADIIAKALSIFETAKARAAAEARRKQEEEARLAAQAGKPAPEPKQEPAPLPTQIRGGYGRAAPIRVVKVITNVTDWLALFGFLKDHPELKDLMLKLAQRALDKGHEVPGVTAEDQRKV